MVRYCQYCLLLEKKKVGNLNYKYYNQESFEDFASGRVILNRAGMTNFPVRLAGEIFKRCIEYTNKNSDITLYDPCCGSGYMLTVLGLLNPQTIGRIICSDVSCEAVSLAQTNLSLLSEQGLLKRKNKILDMIDEYNKQSHIAALSSIDRFIEIIKNRIAEPVLEYFVADALSSNMFKEVSFKADIVIADVPYGNQVAWSDEIDNTVNVLLDNIKPILHKDSVIAIITDKNQKVKNGRYKRFEKFKVGKRQIEILKLKESA
jgi:23S rRNA G2445 N2-methylase RlmL